MTEYNRISGYLNKIFNLCNARFFENALPKVVLTIQSTPCAYGHITCSKVWKNEDGANRHEINIGAGTLARPIENIVATLVHEMVHLYCMENGIKDTSRGTTYHNKKFKQEAEKRASLPARGAWIEIRYYRRRSRGRESLPARGAWIEISTASVKLPILNLLHDFYSILLTFWFGCDII